MDFSASFYSYKRTALVFCAIALLLCAPHVATSTLQVLGISFQGLNLGTLRVLLAIAAMYYFALFSTSAYVEAKTNLLSQESNVSDLKKLLEESTQRLYSAITDFQPILKTAAAAWEPLRLASAIDKMDSIIAEEKIVIRLQDQMDVPPLGRVSATTYNGIMAWLQELQRKLQPTQRFDPLDLIVPIMQHLPKDLEPMVARATQKAVEANWIDLRNNISTANITMADFSKQFREQVARHEQFVTAHREPLSEALFQVRWLSSVRSFRYWALEVGAVGVLFATMLAHVIGTFYRVFPSFVFY